MGDLIYPTSPLLVTALLDDESSAYFQTLRTQYFPPARNIVPAHLSLFHKLPADERQRIEEDLQTACPCADFEMAVSGIKFMGYGVMFTIESDKLNQLRAELATEWRPWLTPQDQQKFAAHIVVQNKVSSAEARQTEAILKESFKPFTASAKGLLLWSYLEGPWRLEKTFLFDDKS